MAAWFIALAWLLREDRYQLFLAPGFGFLIYISLVVCAVFCISLLAEPPVSGKDQLIKGMILILPIVFMGAAGDNTLGSFALSKRPVATMVQKNSDTPLVQDLDAKTLSEPGKDDIQEISIARLVRNWDQYNGRHIRVEGLFFFHDFPLCFQLIRLHKQSGWLKEPYKAIHSCKGRQIIPTKIIKSM